MNKKTVAYLLILGFLLLLFGCGGPSAEELAAVDYTPRTDSEWPISTPAEQGLDPELVAELYANAGEMENIYSLLVFKNGHLVAEDYFNGGSPTQQVNIHSVTKSINSALVGLALEEGCLTSLDQKMMDFFPEFESRIRDPRKRDITIREMLQMRAGYPWEEATAEGTELLFSGFHTADLINVPLARDPGSGGAYSNLTAHLLGLIVARACDTDLKTFADEHLFGPLGIEEGFWQVDWDGDYLGYSDIELSAYDLAKFGLVYMNNGQHNGKQIVPAEWVHDSLQTYSEGVWTVVSAEIGMTMPMATSGGPSVRATIVTIWPGVTAGNRSCCWMIWT